MWGLYIELVPVSNAVILQVLKPQKIVVDPSQTTGDNNTLSTFDGHLNHAKSNIFHQYFMFSYTLPSILNILV